MPLPTDPVWLVTGCSSGFGEELARAILALGWRVAATARGAERLKGLVALAPDRVLAIDLDVTDAGQVTQAVAAAGARFGRIDVLVNNAGYGYQSSIEEGDEAEIRAQFDANVFGLFALTRAVLPEMRARRSGAIVNVTSLAGFVGLPGSGYYAASKHAVEGFSDALLAEVAPLGLTVTCVEPGPFRTDWAGRSLHQTASRIREYANTAAARMDLTKSYSGTQPGDPVRAVQAIIAAVQSPAPPRHLVLGKFAFDTATAKLAERLHAIEGARATALAADFPQPLPA